MTDFETLLKEALNGVRQDFDAAKQDLHEAAANLAKAVQSATDGLATVELVPSNNPAFNNEKHLLYHLYFVPQEQNLGKGERRFIQAFDIAMRGYPIALCHENGVNLQASIQNRQQLDDLFKRLASGKEGSLIPMIAYILRVKATMPPGNLSV